MPKPILIGSAAWADERPRGGEHDHHDDGPDQDP